MKNTLLFHIGRMKTGTTALQDFLYENRKILEQYGWCYPDLKQERPEIQEWNVANRRKNGTFFYTKEGSIDVSSVNWNITWSVVLKHLEKCNVVMSSEELADIDTAEFLESAKGKYENIKVVIYIRRQDRAVESLWNQEVKAALSDCPSFEEFISDEIVESLHYLKKLDLISKIIGKENLIVRAYEKQQFCGEKHTIMSDFMSILGIVPNWDEWKDSFYPNPRLDGNYFEIKKIFNSIQHFQNINIQNGQYAYIFMELSRLFSQKGSAEGYFSPSGRQQFLEQFSYENTVIAREYMHREDGKLFLDDRMDYPVYRPVSHSFFDEDVIRVFSAMICQQNERISDELQRLKRQNYFWAKKFLLQNMKDRKLVFFGAGFWCCELLRNENYPVSLIVDNDRGKCEKTLNGIEIIYAGEIIDWTNYFVVITCVETDEIEAQLCGQGLQKELDFVLAKEYLLYG